MIDLAVSPNRLGAGDPGEAIQAVLPPLARLDRLQYGEGLTRGNSRARSKGSKLLVARSERRQGGQPQR